MSAHAPYLTCHQLALSFGPTTLFNGLSFAVHPGERWGIVGPNGAGKSSLLRILTGSQAPDAGTCALRNGLRMAVVSQCFEVDGTRTVESILRAALPRAYNLDDQRGDIETELAAHAALAGDDPALADDAGWLDKLSRLQDRLDALAGAGTDNILESTLKAGRLNGLAARAYAELSGGQQKRVQIVAALLQNPQLVLLDEPTNHLDVETVDWLEEFLLEIVEQGVGLLGFRAKDASPEPFAFVLVSHDRALLDTLVNKVLEIEAGETKSYEGNYEQYAQLKLENDLFQQKERAKMANLFRRELAWLRRGPAARTTKQTARIERAHELEKTLSGKIQKANVQTKSGLEFQAQMVGESRNAEDQLVATVQTLGEQQLVNLKSVTVAHPGHPEGGTYVCRGLDLVVKPRTRVALLGPNGCGKSTLLNVIAHVNPPAAGEVTFHELTKASYFDQRRTHLDRAETVRRTVCPEGEYVLFNGKYLHVNSYLERFLFWRHDADRPVKDLSGGEQARLLLAKMMLEHGNLLVLDEPTNDLDITTLQILEQNLMDFQGGIVFTSHDRYFLQRVATHLLTYTGTRAIKGETIGEWTMFADLDQALSALESVEGRARAAAPEAAKNAVPTRGGDDAQRAHASPQSTSGKKKLSYGEQKEFAQLEEKIPKLEEEIASLTRGLEEAYAQSKPFSETQRLTAQVELAQKTLEQSTRRWEELFERQA